jgi:hypothetical protein
VIQIASISDSVEEENTWECTAIVSAKEFENSNNRPLLVDGTLRATRDQWVLKPIAKLGVVSSISELVGYRFAAALGIPTPKFGIINLSREVAECAPADLRELLARSVGANFGTRYIAGLPDLTSPDAIRDQDRQDATHIYVWDVIVDNADRRKEKPNLLGGDNGIFAIDHEFAFSWLRLLGSPEPVWVPEILHRLSRLHLLANHVPRWRLSCSTLLARFSSLSTSEIRALTERLPASWLQGEGTPCIEKLRLYLDNVHSRAVEIVQSADPSAA